MRRSFSSLNPVFRFISVHLRRTARRVQWQLGGAKYAKTHAKAPLPYRVYKHQSVLIRRLGETDVQLQYNKAVNLKLAVKKLDGILIHPGETFSFWKTVGCPSRRKGYLEGVMLSNGEAVPGVGGGL
ncbi:MAG: VanW family protein, partial [Oscillospiraceae bacterium]|nr:VanW family protein [Oscillospiraceae bacterium]